MSEDDKWTVPPSDQIAKMSRKDLVDLLHAHIEHVERGDAVNRQGNLPVAFMRAMYLNQELTRRDQNRQTRSIIRMTFAMTIMTLVITFMTLVIMVATIWPQWVQSALHSLLIRAWQVIIDLCGAA